MLFSTTEPNPDQLEHVVEQLHALESNGLVEHKGGGNWKLVAGKRQDNGKGRKHEMASLIRTALASAAAAEGNRFRIVNIPSHINSLLEGEGTRKPSPDEVIRFLNDESNAKVLAEHGIGLDGTEDGCVVLTHPAGGTVHAEPAMAK